MSDEGWVSLRIPRGEINGVGEDERDVGGERRGFVLRGKVGFIEKTALRH